MFKRAITSIAIVCLLAFASCGGGSDEAKELFQEILTLVGIPPEVITNICQTTKESDICDGVKLNKLETTKVRSWQKLTEIGEGQYLIETTEPCEPILVELTDADVVYDNGEFYLKFSGLEEGEVTKELSILKAMVDAMYLSDNGLSAIRELNNTESQNKFYAVLYRDLKININRLREIGLTRTQSIRGTLKEMAEELKNYGVDSNLSNRINSCNNDLVCVDDILNELSVRLLIDMSEANFIFEIERDNDTALSVREVICEEKGDNPYLPYKLSNLVDGKVTFYDNNEKVIAIPSNAYMAITPQKFIEDHTFKRVACPIQSDGVFGSECYVPTIEKEDILKAFNDENEVFDLYVFINEYKPEYKRSECNEDEYRFSYSESGTQLKIDQMSNIIVHSSDFRSASEVEAECNL